MKSMIRNVDDHGVKYQTLMFVCPGCAAARPGSDGVHSLPVNVTNSRYEGPSWTWDGNVEFPTLSPSILTNKDGPRRCHSYLVAGVFDFLADSKHPLVGQKVPLPDLPDWAAEMKDN